MIINLDVIIAEMQCFDCECFQKYNANWVSKHDMYIINCGDGNRTSTVNITLNRGFRHWLSLGEIVVTKRIAGI